MSCISTTYNLLCRHTNVIRKKKQVKSVYGDWIVLINYQFSMLIRRKMKINTNENWNDNVDMKLNHIIKKDDIIDRLFNFSITIRKT